MESVCFASSRIEITAHLMDEFIKSIRRHKEIQPFVERRRNLKERLKVISFKTSLIF
jgi:hypothetical protein